jgi:hypothetical protein
MCEEGFKTKIILPHFATGLNNTQAPIIKGKGFKILNFKSNTINEQNFPDIYFAN